MYYTKMQAVIYRKNVENLVTITTIFTMRLHVIQRTVLRRPFCPSVHLSVCLSVKRMHCDIMKETCDRILIRYERTFILVFRLRRMVGEGRPLAPEILGQTDPVRAKTPFFKKSSVIGSPLRAFE